MKKAIFFDVDGTIVDTFNGGRTISPAVKKAIHDLQAAGHYAFVATGRPYAFINPMLWKFGFDGFVLSNGALVIMKDELIFHNAMDQAFIKEISQKLDKLGIQYVLEGRHDSYIRSDYQAIYDFFKRIGISEQFITREYEVEENEIYKIEILCKDENTKRQCASMIENYPEYGYYYSIDEGFFEVYKKKNNKAKGIEKALEYLGISIENSYAFGDGMNDIEMLKAVGCGFAMGNASDEVKAYADRIADTVSNDGVAKAIYEYILDGSAEALG